jgi:Undecaprenyl-phosphate galactose phosphotransferase WbaP
MSTLAPPLLSARGIRQSVDKFGQCCGASELAIVAADLCALSLPALFTCVCLSQTGITFQIVLPVPAILALFFLFRLYPGVGLHPVSEIRRVFSAMAAALLGLLSLFYNEPRRASDISILFIWAAGMMLVPLVRAAVRNVCARRNWWGHQVFIVGPGDMAQLLIARLQNNPQLGLKPVALFDEFSSETAAVSGIPAYGSLDAMYSLAERHRVSRAIVIIPSALQNTVVDLIESKAPNVSRLLVVIDVASPTTLDIYTRDVSRSLAIEVPRTLLLPGPRLVKRAVDIVVTAAIGILAAPLMAILCLLIKLDSPGAIFYVHRRIGRGHRTFNVCKFRSMMVNGDAILQQHLRDNPAAAEEWRRTQKLQNDPRITRLGRFLRITSLDELPQLWNILRGDMSLVGPRPVVEAEMHKYGSMFSHYAKVAPGLTGLWQVSGRNNTTYEERIELDTYYVRNWSLCLDLYLLARTVFVVMRREGAY